MSEETQEEQPVSRQIRLFDDRVGFYRSGADNGNPNIYANGFPSFETNYPESANTNKTADPVDNVHDAWWFEDFHSTSAISGIKSLDGKRTILSSDIVDSGGHIGGTNGIFRSYVGVKANPTVEANPFVRNNPGCLQFGVPAGDSTAAKAVCMVMGTVPGTISKLNNRKAVFDYPIGMGMSFDTAASVDLIANAYRLRHLSILYKQESSNDIKYGAIVENRKWMNDNLKLLSPSLEQIDILNYWGKDDVNAGWTITPLIGGSFSGFISEAEINIIKSTPGYRAVGMVMTWDVQAGKALNFFDIKPYFNDGSIPATKSRRLLQPPQKYADSFNLKSFKLA